MGFPCFGMSKDKGMIQYIHSLIPFSSSCCDMHTVGKTHFLQNPQNAHLCVPFYVSTDASHEERLYFSNMAQQKPTNLRINYKNMAAFSVPLKCSSETGETALTRVPVCASFCFFKKIHMRQRGTKDSPF